MNTSVTPSESGQQATTPMTSDGDLQGQRNSPRSSKTPARAGREAFRQLLESAEPEQKEPPLDDDGKPEPEPLAASDDHGPDQHDVDDSADTGGDDPVVEQLTLKSVADQLGLTETELYDTLRISTGDGQSLTLGETKAKLAKQAEAMQGIATREAEAEQLQAKYVSDVQALGVLTAMKAIPDDIRAQASQHLMNRAQEEMNNFRMLHPEYQDETRWGNFTHQVDELLKPHGLSSLHFGVRSLGIYTLMKQMLADNRDAKLYRQPKPKPVPSKTKASRMRGNDNGSSTVTVSGSGRSRFEQVARSLKG